jgi:hypothetical protein
MARFDLLPTAHRLQAPPRARNCFTLTKLRAEIFTEKFGFVGGNGRCASKRPRQLTFLKFNNAGVAARNWAALGLNGRMGHEIQGQARSVLGSSS